VADEKRGADDLFGDEELGPPMPASGGRREKRGGGGLWLVLVLIVGLLGGAFWYLSDANHERYFLRVDGDSVAVERGLFFPVGTRGWAPNRAYEPFRVPRGVKVQAAGPIELEGLDQRLLALYQDIARSHLKDLRKGKPEEAEKMLLRAGKLFTTDVGDERKLLELLGDVSFRQGLSKIQGIEKQFDDALRQFKLAAMRGGREYKGAAEWVTAIERLKAEFRALSVESGLDPDAILTGKSPDPTPDEIAPLPKLGGGGDAGVDDEADAGAAMADAGAPDPEAQTGAPADTPPLDDPAAEADEPEKAPSNPFGFFRGGDDDEADTAPPALGTPDAGAE
jgi:hypothetical protein